FRSACAIDIDQMHPALLVETAHNSIFCALHMRWRSAMSAALHRIQRSFRTCAIAVLVVIALGVGAATPANAGTTTCSDCLVDVALSPQTPSDQHVAVTLCVPRHADTVQVLLHGSTYD